MTAKQLIRLIRTHFNDDEEVLFLTHDFYGDYRNKKVEFKEHTRERPIGHYERLGGPKGCWERCNEYEVLGFEKTRFVKEGVSIDSRKVLDICG